MTLQLAEFVVGVPRMQLMLLKLPALPLGPLRVKLTVPEGADGLPLSISVTVAVQFVGAFSGRVVGEQETEVEVDRFVTVNVFPVASALSACTPSFAV